MGSNEPTAAELRTMFDEHGVARLQAAYGDAVTRRAWKEVAEMFVPECPLRLDVGAAETRTITGGEAVASLIATSIERFEFFEFALLNSVVDIVEPGAQATGRLYMWELRQDGETGRWTNAYGLYRDRYEHHEGRWRFAERRYSSLARTNADGDAMLVFPIPHD